MADPLRPPRHGVRVLELAHLIAGPMCGMYLADMGADVVKVESREAPDAGRSVYPRAMRNGEGALHPTVNRHKRGICLDVKQPEGRDAFRRLAVWADVIIEGFRGGVAITEQHHPRAGTFKTVATPVKLEKTPGTIRTPAPRLGEHSRDVLAEAGFTTAEIDSLPARSVI